jgi:hypothetical protein
MQDVILIDVPEDATDIKTHILDGITKIVFSSSIQDPLRCGGDMLRLPPGSWTIVEQTEEGAAKIMPKINDEDESYGWEHFMSDEEFEKHDRVDALPTALASLHSWIRSQGKEPKTSIILKKEI